MWVLTAMWGTLFQLAISPFSWMDAAMAGVGERVSQMMEDEADREPEERGPKRKAISMEDLRRKYSWWPKSSGDKEPVALIDMGAAEAGEAVPWSIKSTNL